MSQAMTRTWRHWESTTSHPNAVPISQLRAKEQPWGRFNLIEECHVITSQLSRPFLCFVFRVTVCGWNSRKNNNGIIWEVISNGPFLFLTISCVLVIYLYFYSTAPACFIRHHVTTPHSQISGSDPGARINQEKKKKEKRNEQRTMANANFPMLPVAINTTFS